MIFVDGVPLSLSKPTKGNDILGFLLQHPTLLSAANSLICKKILSLSESSQEWTSDAKFVYVFQREYATIDPDLVELIGMDEATTCVGLVIRDRKSGMTCVAHLDSPRSVNMGLSQMLLSMTNYEENSELDVHLIGGFDDSPMKLLNRDKRVQRKTKSTGFSLPLCSSIVEALHERNENFNIKTLCVLGHNTQNGSDGNALPIITGFVVEASSGSIIPAIFDRSSRCPDEVVRRIRVIVSFMDSRWKDKLLETYDTKHDTFQIASCVWSQSWKNYALSLLQYSDSEILFKCSTSPYAEGPGFVEDHRRILNYLIKYPDWRTTFPNGEPHVFKRNGSSNQWLMC